MTVGYPLLADEIAEFSLQLPSDYKLRRFKLRWFFKEALRDFLPNATIKKKKHGFGLPLAFGRPSIPDYEIWPGIRLRNWRVAAFCAPASGMA